MGAFALGLADGMSATDGARAAASSRASSIPPRARLIRPTAFMSGPEKEVPVELHGHAQRTPARPDSPEDGSRRGRSHRGFTHPQCWSASTSPNGVALIAGAGPQSTRPHASRAQHRRTAGCLSPKRTAAGQARARRLTESHPMAIGHPRPAEVRTMQTIHAAVAIPQSLLGRHGDVAPTCWCGQDLEHVGRVHCPRCGRAANRRSVPPAEPAHSS